MSEPKEHILVLRRGVAWKATTQMLHEHNNSSHLSLLCTGIPLASVVQSVCVLCLRGQTVNCGWDDEGTASVLE